MRLYQKILALLTVLALMLTITGCGQQEAEPTTEPTTAPSAAPAITAAQVFSNVTNTMAQELTTRYRVTLGFSCRYADSQTGEEQVDSCDLESEILISGDPFGRSNMALITVTKGDSRRTLAVQQYDVLENGTVVTYSRNAADFWTVVDTGLDPESYINTAGASIYIGEVWPGVSVIDNLSAELAATTQDGTQVYTLHGTLPFSHFKTVIDSFNLTCHEDQLAQALPVVWYVDAETFSIVRAEVDLTAVSGVIRDFVTASLPEDTRENASFTLSGLVYELGTGPQSIPELPPDAKETQDSKVLRCGDSYVYIDRPDEWSFSDVTRESLTVKCKAASADIRYLSGVTDEDFRNDIAGQVAYLKDLGLYKSHCKLDPINGYQITQILTSGTDYYYAWKTIGEGVISLEISDYFYDDPQALLSLLTDCITPYAP